MKTNFFSLVLLGLTINFAAGCASSAGVETNQSDASTFNVDDYTGWWRTLQTPSGTTALPAREITYHIDSESCNDEVAEKLRVGFKQASVFWANGAGTLVTETQNKSANLFVICDDFPKENKIDRRPYRLRTLELNRDNSINSMIVEVADNWQIFTSEAESKGWTVYNPWAYSNVGVGHAAFGLMHGVEYKMGFWRHSYVPDLDHLQRIKFN